MLRMSAGKQIKYFIAIGLGAIFSPMIAMATIDTTSINSPRTTITQAQSMMIQQTLLNKNYATDLLQIDHELQTNPNNVNLLYKKAVIYVDIEQYKKALIVLDQILALQPKNEQALLLKTKIEKLLLTQPRNELGINDDEAYVSDVNGYWQYTSLHYYRFTQYGTFGARVNYAKRFGTTGEQYQLEGYPIFPTIPHLRYIYLSGAYANSTQILLPNWQYNVEPYVNIAKNIDASLGAYGLHSIGVNIYTYTASLAWYTGNNYLWFRPYHYIPKSSDLFEIGIRHYFSENNTFISIKAATGHAPDILDLAPLNQIVVLAQNLIALNGQFPIAKNVYLQAGAGYTRQKFPNGNIREITDGNLGVIWQF